MDIKTEVILILQKAKAKDSYHNPYLVRGLIDAIDSIYGENTVPDELND